MLMCLIYIKTTSNLNFPAPLKLMELIFPTKKKLLNNFFFNIGSKLAETIFYKHQTKPFDSYLKDRCVSTFNFVPVTCDEVISVIHEFAPKKSTGHDLISTNLLKEISPLIAEPLSLIINQSLSTGIFPSKFKKSPKLYLYTRKMEKTYWTITDQSRYFRLSPKSSKE